MPTKQLCVLVFIRINDEVGISPPVFFFTDRSNAVLLLWIPFSYWCFMFAFVMLSCLLLAALWSPAGKGLTSWIFVCCVAGQVWYLLYFTSYAMHMLVAVQRKTQIVSELLKQFTNVFEWFFNVLSYADLWGIKSTCTTLSSSNHKNFITKSGLNP